MLYKLYLFQSHARRLGALGGGGRSGTPPEDGPELPLPAPNKFVPLVGFFSLPGIDIENVCPSLRV